MSNPPQRRKPAAQAARDVAEQLPVGVEKAQILALLAVADSINALGEQVRAAGLFGRRA